MYITEFGSPLCGTIFLNPAPNSTALLANAPFSLLMYFIPSDNHISVYRTKIHRAVAKLSHFFHFVSVWDDPFPAPTFLLARVVTIVTSHYSIAVHIYRTLFMSQINLKKHINELKMAKLCGEFKYDCLRSWLSKELATDTWNVCHGKHSYFLINARMIFLHHKLSDLLTQFTIISYSSHCLHQTLTVMFTHDITAFTLAIGPSQQLIVAICVVHNLFIPVVSCYFSDEAYTLIGWII